MTLHLRYCIDSVLLLPLVTESGLESELHTKDMTTFGLSFIHISQTQHKPQVENVTEPVLQSLQVKCFLREVLLWCGL